MSLLPEKLIASLQNIKGFNEESFRHAHHTGEQITSIRFNPEKATEENLLSADTKVSWCPYGYYLPERPSFTLDPVFHAGVYYVQEASSMFLWEVLRQTGEDDESMRILDLCAAPGGKTTLLASYFTKGLIVANEVIKSRASVLVENIIKWGSDNVVVTNNDPKDFKRLKGFFDVMVVDAPCSGSGLFRKDTEAIEEWSEANVLLCSERQKRILADAFSSLKKEGILIYSTCSYSCEEDEEILDWIMNEYSVETIQLKLNEDWEIIETISPQHKAYGYRFYPDKTKGEGFFIAAFKKKEGNADAVTSRPSGLIKASKNEAAMVKHLVDRHDTLLFIKHKDTVIAVPEIFEDDIALLNKSLYIRKQGIAAGILKGKDFVPEHALALSLVVNNAIPFYELNKEQALQYLRKKEVLIDTTQKGWMLVRYEGHNLGWIKVLQNRVNNYYPVEWRILKD